MSIREKVSFVQTRCLFVLPYFLIYSISLSNLVIVAFCLLTILCCLINRSFPFERDTIILVSAAFLITLFGILYTMSLSQAVRILETRSPLIVLPVFVSLAQPSDTVKFKVYKNFILSLVFTFIICLVFAVYNNFLDPSPSGWFNKWHYSYDHLTSPIDVQPLYMALFVGFAILIIMLQLVGLSTVKLFKTRSFSIFVLAFLIVFLTLLSTRLIILILLLLVFALPFFFYSKINWRSILVVAAFLISTVSLIILSPVTRERFEGLKTRQFEFSSYSLDRIIIWSVALKYIKENPEEFIFGLGTGSSENLMENLYKANGINWDFPQKTNTHNQYLDFLINQGLFGLLLFLISLFYLFRKVFMSKDWVGVSFVLLLSLAFIGENYLSRQKGVVFFGFISSLIFLTNHHGTPSKKSPSNREILYLY